MNKKRVLKAAFFRQFSGNDCGMACLSTILKLSGKDGMADCLRKRSPAGHSGNSLLELRNISREMDVSCRCVKMDLQFLKGCHSPVILHVKNECSRDHFEVCFGSEIKKKEHLFLMADPATGIYFINEKDLAVKWQSRAALCFEDIPVARNQNCPVWKRVTRTNYVTGLLWLAIPLLNTLVALMGIAITWVIEKEMQGSLVNRQARFLFTITILLLIIHIGKALCGYINRMIMMHISAGIGDKLFTGLLRIIRDRAQPFAAKDAFIRSSMAEMQKIEGGCATLVASLFPDAIFCMAIFFIDIAVSPVSGLLNLAALALMAAVLIRYIPRIALRGARAAELKACTDSLLRNEFAAGSGPAFETAQETIRLRNARYISLFRSWHIAINKLNLWLELIGAMNIVSALAIGLAALQRQSISGNDFLYIVVLSYFLTNMMIRVAVSLIGLNDAATASRNFEARGLGAS